MEDTQGIYIRQTGIIDPAKLTHKIAIIGGGSIGSWTALCLGKLGCTDITVYDFDTVEIHNAGSQIYKSSDEGQLKTEALQFRLEMLLETPVKTKHRWTPGESLEDYDIVIAAVDSITVRKEIFAHLRQVSLNCLYIDPRMAGNALEIYTTHMRDAQQCEHYAETLFDESEALPIHCSERSVVYNVFVVGGLIGDLVAQYANGEKLPQELTVDLLNFTMFN